MSVPILIVQGGQWGSEAKGSIASHLCRTRNIEYAVRTGAINAGHTTYYKGNRYVNQLLPVGWVNPDTKLVLGAGCYIHPPTLWTEIDMINRAMPESDVRRRLYIDYRCGLHDEAAESRAKEANRHHKMGATGKGCSEAIVAKISQRGTTHSLFINSDKGREFRERNMVTFTDTAVVLNGAYDAGKSILLEGTQGHALDLHLGPWPYTTSRMTTAANWIAECGLAPSLEYETVLVVRTFPIRVAGNSGPMRNEMEWTDLAREINTKLFDAGKPALIESTALRAFERNLQEAAAEAVNSGRYKVPTMSFSRHFNVTMSKWDTDTRCLFQVAASELNRDALNRCDSWTLTELRKLFEMTTVTKKLRRIARLDKTDLQEAVMINRPSWIALTFLDYVEPELRNATGIEADSGAAWLRAAEYLGDLEKSLGVPIKMVSTGPLPEHIIEVRVPSVHQVKLVGYFDGGASAAS